MDDFLHHLLRLGDFAWELRNHGWSNSSASPRAQRPGHTGGSLRRRATTLPLPHALTRTS